MSRLKWLSEQQRKAKGIEKKAKRKPTKKKKSIDTIASSAPLSSGMDPQSNSGSEN